MSETPQQIDYAPHPKWHERVNWRKWMFRLCIAFAVIVGLFVAARALRQYFIYRQQENALEAYTRWTKLDESSVTHAEESIRLEAQYCRFIRSLNLWCPGNSPVLFFGKRESSNGLERLIVVLSGQGAGFIPASPSRGAERTDSFLLLSGPLSSGTLELVQKGQPDPADASHFTFKLKANETEFTFDGWLQVNGTVKIEPREPITTQPR